MNQILYSRKNEQRAKILALVFCALLAILIIVSVSFGIANKTNNKILKGVYIGEVYVGGMTSEEAEAKLDAELAKINDKTVELFANDYSKTISGKDVGASYNNTLVENAYNYGRTGNLIADNYTVLFSYFNKKYQTKAEIELNDFKYQELLNTLTAEMGTTLQNDTYEVLAEEIKVVKGQEGRTIKEEELKEKLAETLMKNHEKVEIPFEIGKPERVDFEKIYEEVFVEKVEASYKTGEAFEVVKDVRGVSFDKEVAKNEYDALEDGKEMSVKLVFAEPETTVDDLNKTLFKDVLATFSTKYDKYYTNRVTNLEVSGRKVNGTILYPGDEFSYNEVVGKRTAANGFKDAHVFAGGKVVDGMGGGICQVSTTLYNTVLLTDLKVTERKNHMMHTGYNDPGRDATVVYGSIDFRFVNTRKTPIKLEMIVKNGIVTSTIYGLKEENEPIVEIKSVILKTIPYTTIEEEDNTMDEGTTKVVQSPLNGYESETYKIIKDASGKEISKTLVSKDSYKQTSKIIKVGTKKVEVVAPVEPEIPVVPETPVENPDTSLPTGWDNPESPYIQ